MKIIFDWKINPLHYLLISIEWRHHVMHQKANPQNISVGDIKQK